VRPFAIIEENKPLVEEKKEEASSVETKEETKPVV
jgi:hypothetical protein